ncbi:MAG: response regulator transcription factor [Pseudomonadota bacterium]|uniref:Response regulator transcription factor n=1 Tax=Caldimonas aquatica TaxID=376175 RepID=A0ABY6MP63_9BURK|nr:response regulator transcription factor [Schlegelella aquatica]UZD54283.1 response regulator transcription factor [Schlegelella aquatica]
MNAPIRILLVDDHNLFRRGLAALLAQEPTLQVVGQAGDAGEAQRLLAELRPDVMLLDNHLPGVRGVDAIPGLREVHPGCRIIVLTVSEDGADLAAALKAGAAGYLLKTVEGEMLIDGIRRAMRGESVVSPEMTEKLIAAFRSATASPAQAEEAEEPESDAGHGGLSPRETEILREIARGASNKEIARTLGIAETTVKIHVQRILRKLNLTSRVQAAVYASGRGLA